MKNRVIYFMMMLFCAIVHSLSAQKKENLSPADLLLKRPVMARIYQNQQWTLGKFSVDEVAVAIQKLSPSYVSGLIYLDSEKTLSPTQINDYQKIREKILKENPDCKFDFVLNPRQFKKPEEAVAKMKSIQAVLKIDVWFLDYYKGNYKGDGKVLEAMVEYAHAQNQLIGANEWDKSVVKNVDFVVFNDGNGVEQKQRQWMESIADEYKIPIGLQINHDIDRTDNDNIHTFMKKWDKVKRELHIKRLARNQTTWRYRFFYPVFFPIYLNREAYNAAQDGNILVTYLELMKLFNP